MPPSPALLTDRYELTMLAAALADGTADRDCAFEVFARRLPHGRRYGVLAGTGRLLDALGGFRFGDEDLAALEAQGLTDPVLLAWLADFAFTGDVEGYAEGELYFPGSPVLGVRAPFGQAVLLETLVLSILNHDSAIASAAARMVGAAGGRPCIEMGSRRTHEEAAVAAARAAWLVGFASTSNLAAGARYGVPTAGTSAHAFTLLHDDEAAAFRAQVDALGTGTTLLVDTYDTLQGIRTAIEVAGTDLGAVRLDSGDLGTAGRAGPGAAGLPRRRPHPGDGHQRPGRVRHRRAGRRPGRRLRRGHLPGHRLGCTHRRHGLQARRAGRRAGGQDRPRASGRWVGGRPPSAGTTTRGPRPRRSSSPGTSSPTRATGR